MPADNYKRIHEFIPDDSTILDLGCGNGIPFQETNYPKLIGIDIFRKRFDMPEYDLVIFHDALRINELFLDNSFDVVIGIDFIEHLSRENGFEIMEKAEKIAKKKVIFFTPKEWSTNKQGVEDPHNWSYGNPANYHKSIWTEEDFTDRGYKVLGYQGFVFVEKEVK